MTRILVSAHMGGPEGNLPPNSLAAAKAVRDDGVDLIEFDVRVTIDGQFITMHDAEVTHDQDIVPVEQLTANEILRDKPNASLLADMLDVVHDHAIAHVDLKDTTHEVAIVDACIAKLGVKGFFITTLEDSSVLKIRQQRPNVAVALALGRDTRNMPRLLAARIRISEYLPYYRIYACRPTMVAAYYKLAWPGLLWYAYMRKLPVLVWTINTPDLMYRYWRNPFIWAFTTNYPRQALALQNKTDA